jgi:hypothetical protein
VGPTSLALIAVLAVLAGLLMAGALTFWPVLARSGAARILGRIMVICALDVVVLGLILVIANRSSSFYASWSELLGTEHVSGQIVAWNHDQGAAGDLDARDGQLTITARLMVAVPGHPRADGGRLLAVTMTGPESGITTNGYVYVPAEAARPSARRSGLSLPVIVVISDRLGVQGAVFSARQIASTAAAEIATARLRPVLIVMLPPRIAPGAGRSCLDVPGGPQAATFFAADLPDLIRSGLPASADSAQWAVAGDRAGAYCALQLALNDSDVFSVAAAPPGYYTPEAAPKDVGPSQLIRQQENLLYLLGHQPMQPVTVVLTGGPEAARPILAAARAPMRVAVVPLATGRWPFAPVLDAIGRLLGTVP